MVCHLAGLMPELRPFDFAQLVTHAAKSRRLGAGTIIGSGTVSNRGVTAARACRLARVDGATPALPSFACWKQSTSGQPHTPFMTFGDRVRIEIFDEAGESFFGRIEQIVEKYDV